jgi:uncharacterized coiled-coil protein SlyX
MGIFHWRRGCWEQSVLRYFDAIVNLLDRQGKKLEALMSGFDDLKAAVESLTTAVNNEISVVNDVIAKMKQGGGLSDAEAEALAQKLQGSVDNLNAEAQSVQNPPSQG